MQDTADYGRSTWQTLTGHAQWQATPAWSHHYAFEILQEKSAFYGTWANQMHGQQKQSAWRSTWQQAAWQVELGHYGRWENYSSLGHKQNEQHLFIWGRYAYHPQGTVSYGLRTIWGHHPTIVQQAAVAREFKLRSLLLRPHAAWGTAFKRPSLYQKFEPRWGNSALQAEKSCQQEFGLAWGQAAWQGDVTFFWGRAERGIIFNWDAEGGRYQNGPKIKQKGLSASWQWKRTSYQVMASVTTFWGKRLPYTPTWQSRITWQQNWGQHWQGHLAYAYQGSRRESDFSKLKPYHYGSAAVIYTRKDWQIEGRIENLWRHKYVQMHGYNVDPQSFILTASYQH